MTKGWFGEKGRHRLSALGIPTTLNKIKPITEEMNENGHIKRKGGNDG